MRNDDPESVRIFRRFERHVLLDWRKEPRDRLERLGQIEQEELGRVVDGEGERDAERAEARRLDIRRTAMAFKYMLAFETEDPALEAQYHERSMALGFDSPMDALMQIHSHLRALLNAGRKDEAIAYAESVLNSVANARVESDLLGTLIAEVTGKPFPVRPT